MNEYFSELEKRIIQKFNPIKYNFTRIELCPKSCDIRNHPIKVADQSCYSLITENDLVSFFIIYKSDVIKQIVVCDWAAYDSWVCSSPPIQVIYFYNSNNLNCHEIRCIGDIINKWLLTENEILIRKFLL